MWLIGDIHGDMDFHKRVINEAEEKGQHTLQVGDFGMGFGSVYNLNLELCESIDDIHTRHKFIRGNHDKPLECRNSPMYLGDYGTFTVDTGKKVFYISGAYSIDKDWRIPGKNWWHDEQLSESVFDECADLYFQVKPDIVITHDAPNCVLARMYAQRGNSFPSLTSKRLQDILFSHAPELWFFGHHHKTWFTYFGKTHFRCLTIGEVIDVPQLGKYVIDNERVI